MSMKVAIVHDWLVTYTGAEKVLEQIFKLFPEADLYCVVDFIPPGKRDFISGKTSKTTFLQKFPRSRKLYRKLLPLMPLAIEQFDLTGYDLVISSSHAVAKGVITGPNQLHISYVHSPIRYAWDLQHQYLTESGLDKGVKGMVAKWLLHKMRVWDYRTCNSVDSLIANSEFISRRIWKVYRRESKVIYPPVDINGFEFSDQKEDYYITLSRLVPYKKIDLIVEAFSQMPDKKLIVVGDGPDYKKIKALAGPNVEMLGYQPQQAIVELIQKARAFVFAAEEDFGISVVEAQAAGTPVIAYGKGGALETVRGLDHSKPTGVFYPEQTVISLQEGVYRFEHNEHRIEYRSCRANAERFSNEVFLRNFENHIKQVMQEQHTGGRVGEWAILQ